MDLRQGGGVDRRPHRTAEGAGAARLGVPAADRAQPAGPAPAARARGRPGGAGRFSKSLTEAVAEERARHPEAAVELWAFDEHRAGLKPVLRRVWAKRGRRPVAAAEPRYQWLDLYGFVRPTTGPLVGCLGTTVNTARFAAVLARVAAAVGAGPTKRVLLVLDGAGWPTSAGLA